MGTVGVSIVVIVAIVPVPVIEELGGIIGPLSIHVTMFNPPQQKQQCSHDTAQQYRRVSRLQNLRRQSDRRIRQSPLPITTHNASPSSPKQRAQWQCPQRNDCSRQSLGTSGACLRKDHLSCVLGACLRNDHLSHAHLQASPSFNPTQWHQWSKLRGSVYQRHNQVSCIVRTTSVQSL